MVDSLNTEVPLSGIPGESPTGPDLGYDPAFIALNQAATEKPAQYTGDQISRAAVPPDWAEVQEQATALLERTKDLRVAVHLAHAATCLDGLPGLAAGLQLIHGFLDQWWDEIHPRLDPEDDNDPTLRVNSLLPLQDPERVAGAVMLAPMVFSRTLGRFSYRDHLVVRGDLGPLPDDKRVIEASHIDAAFMDSDLDELKATAAAIQGASEALGAIDAAITNQIGAPNGPDLSRLATLLNDINVVVTGQLAHRGVGEVVAGEEGAARAVSPQSNVSSREEAIRALDRVCDYFERQEPSSPVPLLLRRAQRLARMDFMDILRDMTPGGVAEAEAIGGVRGPDA